MNARRVLLSLSLCTLVAVALLTAMGAFSAPATQSLPGETENTVVLVAAWRSSEGGSGVQTTGPGSAALGGIGEGAQVPTVPQDCLPALAKGACLEKAALVPVPLCPDDKIDYSVTLWNTSTDQNTGTQSAKINDIIPNGTNLQSGSLTGGAQLVGNVIRWTGNLAPGQKHTIGYTLVVKGGAEKEEEIVNQAVGTLGALQIEPVKLPLPVTCPSITVIKQDKATGDLVAGIQMYLYKGAGCQGDPIKSGVTGGSPIPHVDFINLEPNVYSVREEFSGSGWVPVGSDCTDKPVPVGAGGGAAGLPACPVPDDPFPAAGCDQFPSGAGVTVRLAGSETEIAVTLNGPTLIERGPIGDADSDSLADVQTEIIAMELTGLSPVLGRITVTESPTLDSLGQFEEQLNTGGVFNFPADSFFNVFFVVDLPDLGLTLENKTALHIECKITSIPPVLCLYQPPLGDEIALFDANGPNDSPLAYIVHAKHLPLFPYEQLVDFINVADKDGDGCSDERETLPKSQANEGGGRDANNPWDYYDVLGPNGSLTRDGVIDLPNDILGVIQHFSPQGQPPYDANFDRGPATVAAGGGPNPWNMTAPDGVIDLPNDILGVILQFNHNCR